MLMQDSVSIKGSIISAKMSTDGKMQQPQILMAPINRVYQKVKYYYINPSSPLLIMKDFFISVNQPTDS
jgi:hypothetical protein